MIIKSENAKTFIENPPMGGNGVLHIKKLNTFTPECKNLVSFNIATLEPGAEVGYHLHTGEIESYYIISGEAVYNDNGKEVSLSSGDITYTPNGESHGIKNASDKENLVFVTLIVKD